jgi:hypothetical protein
MEPAILLEPKGQFSMCRARAIRWTFSPLIPTQNSCASSSMIQIIKAVNIDGELWLMVKRPEFWAIQRNSIGHPRHMGTADYINRVWRKKYLQGVA